MKRGAGKRKGSAFERDVARLFDKYWKVPKNTFWRTPNSGGWHEVGDVYSRDKSIWFPFIVECKAYKTLDLLRLLKDPKKTKLYKWWSQVTSDASKANKEGRDSSLCRRLLVIKINNFPILAVFNINEMPIVKELIRSFKLLINDDSVILCLFSDFQKAFPKEYLETVIRK